MRFGIFLAAALFCGTPTTTHSQTPAPASGSAISRIGSFPGSDAAVRAVICPHAADCVVDFIVAGAAGPRGESFAIARARTARTVCVDERGYRDYLIVARAIHVRSVRELVQGLEPYVEWELSFWAFENGEFVFTHSLLGAPTAPGTDNRATRLHIRPSPLAITQAFRGDEAIAAQPLPACGPIVRLAQE